MAKSYAGSFAGINYQELIGSGAMEYRQDGLWAERRFRVAWDDRLSFVRCMFALNPHRGNESEPGQPKAIAGKLFRQFPDDRRLEAKSVRVEPICGGREKDTSMANRTSDLLGASLGMEIIDSYFVSADLPMITYQHADIVVTYGPRKQPIERWGVQSALNSESRPPESFQWNMDTPTPVTDSIAVPSRVAELTFSFGSWETSISRHSENLSIFDGSNINAALGKIQSKAWAGAPAQLDLFFNGNNAASAKGGVILFHSWCITPTNYCGAIGLLYTYRFRWNANGWNFKYRKESSGFIELEGAGGGDGPYSEMDFLNSTGNSIIPIFDTDFP